MNNSLLALTYMVYIIVYECLVIGGCAYIVFWKGYSGWWFVLAVLMSAGAYKPSAWRKLWAK